MIVLCSNNYLGLANHPEVVAAGHRGAEASTARAPLPSGSSAARSTATGRSKTTIARFVGTPAAAVSYVSCWNANEAVFPTLVGPDDVILSDELNHASIIDSIRLVSKAIPREVYQHSDLADLEAKLKQHAGKACRWVVTDGVFSMEGDVARLPELVAPVPRIRAPCSSSMIRTASASWEAAAAARPSISACMGKIDILTGTLGKALGGAAGGYVAAAPHVIEMLQQRARPSLFSNALPATVACSARTSHRNRRARTRSASPSCTPTSPPSAAAWPSSASICTIRPPPSSPS